MCSFCMKCTDFVCFYDSLLSLLHMHISDINVRELSHKYLGLFIFWQLSECCRFVTYGTTLVLCNICWSTDTVLHLFPGFDLVDGVICRCLYYTQVWRTKVWCHPCCSSVLYAICLFVHYEYYDLFVLCSEIINNTEHHIRVIELLLQSNRWDEKLPDCITAPGLYLLLVFVESIK